MPSSLLLALALVGSTAFDRPGEPVLRELADGRTIVAGELLVRMAPGSCGST